MNKVKRIYTGATLRPVDYVLEPYTDFDPKRGGSNGMPRDDEEFPSSPVGLRSLPVSEGPK